MSRTAPATPQIPWVYPNENYKFPWDDLRAPATSLHGTGADRDTDGSLLFSAVTTEAVYIILQMPHSWREGSTISPHVHWSKTTDAAGDVEWEMRYRVIGIGDVPPDWSAWFAATARSADPGSTQAHTLDAFPDITMTGETLSTVISVNIRRKHDAADDTYDADARLWEFDIHYQSDGLGSIEEFSKEEVS